MQGGAQVSLFSRRGTKAWFCSFVGGKETRTALKKEGDVFSGLVKGIKAGDFYGFRVAGPWAPEKGHRFDASKLLVDPYATCISGPFTYDPDLSQRGLDTALIGQQELTLPPSGEGAPQGRMRVLSQTLLEAVALAERPSSPLRAPSPNGRRVNDKSAPLLVPRCIVEEALPDLPLRTTKPPRFIYELGVKSFTKLHPDVPEGMRGTVAAIAHPAIIDHLKKIGVDTIELMPIHAWIDERHLQALGLTNAWGYNSVQFFALDPRICPGGWAELRDTIAALHEHGIQVVLDVVFNHSGEGDQFGPTVSFRGLDNATYYAQTNGELHNDAGTGNTLALNNPPVMQMVLASLRHAVLKAGVDGFRFDLATALGRMDDGFHADAPLIKAITDDPILGSRILIAEPWDVGPGGYRLGNFPAGWLEWNDQYRDGLRRFWRGDYWSANNLATQLCGSSDIFATRNPSASVNFIAAHDGFTLRDLTRYAEKQNHINGENDRDGNGSEVSWPSGNARALLATLFLSRGTMMLTAGDEFGRTQYGNNNAYAQDNEITWLNWAKKDEKLITFVCNINALRQQLESFLEDRFITSKEATWFGADGGTMPWNRNENFLLGFKLVSANGEKIALMFNASDDEAPLPLKPEKGKSWQRIFTSDEGHGCPAHGVAVFQLRADSATEPKRRK